jgi:hypothetical protein
MYLAKRKNSFASSAAFRPRWRQHGALAMSLPSWSLSERYVHADVQPSSPVGRAHEFDGVGIAWLRELLAGEGTAQESTEDGAILLKDELEAFDGPVLPRAFIVSERVLRANHSADITAFLFFDKAEDAERAAALFTKLSPPLGRVVMNAVADYAPSPTPIYGYRGIVELSSSDRNDLDNVLVAGQRAGIKPDLEVITRECLLWDHGPVKQAVASA